LVPGGRSWDGCTGVAPKKSVQLELRHVAYLYFLGPSTIGYLSLHEESIIVIIFRWIFLEDVFEFCVV